MTDDVIEKIEAREIELAEHLEKVPYGDPEYKYVAENAKIIAEIKDKHIRTENERLNNNERNDLDRMKIEVEMERVKTERMKIKAGVVGDVLDLGKAGLFSWICYNGDKISYAIKDIKDVAKAYLRSRRH